MGTFRTPWWVLWRWDALYTIKCGIWCSPHWEDIENKWNIGTRRNSVSGRGEGVSKVIYLLSFQRKHESLMTAVDYELHLENLIKNILWLFSSANTSILSKNFQKFQTISSYFQKKRKKTNHSVYRTKEVVILKHTGQLIKNSEFIKCAWIRNMNSRVKSRSILSSRPA